MATKKELLAEAQAAGHVAEDASADDFTVAQLETLLGRGDHPAWDGSLSASGPLVAPDGHVNLSQEDLDARNS
jgi:hypothetical protein